MHCRYYGGRNGNKGQIITDCWSVDKRAVYNTALNAINDIDHKAYVNGKENGRGIRRNN